MEPLTVDTVVRYRGSLEEHHHVEFKVAKAEKDKHIECETFDDDHVSSDGYRYLLTPVIRGSVSRDWQRDYIWNVRRQSLTVAGEEKQ